MKKILFFTFILFIFSNNGNAKSFNLDRATGDCKASRNLFSGMSYDVYKNTFVKLKLDFKFSSGATYKVEGLLKNMYWIETRFREAIMACLQDDSQVCKKLLNTQNI